MWGIHRWQHKGQWRGTLMFSLFCAWRNGWVNNREGGDLRRHRAHYDVIGMKSLFPENPCLFHILSLLLGQNSWKKFFVNRITVWNSHFLTNLTYIYLICLYFILAMFRVSTDYEVWEVFPSKVDYLIIMMKSSNGNIFRVTGHLCGEFTGSPWIPHTKASDAELWCFLLSAPERTVE